MTKLARNAEKSGETRRWQATGGARRKQAWRVTRQQRASPATYPVRLCLLKVAYILITISNIEQPVTSPQSFSLINIIRRASNIKCCAELRVRARQK